MRSNRRFRFRVSRSAIGILAVTSALASFPKPAAAVEHSHAAAAADPSAVNTAVIQSARSGVWSAGETWAGGKVPSAGARVEILPGHQVTYDVDSDKPIRSLLVEGKLSFARDRDTRLDVGMLVVGAVADRTMRDEQAIVNSAAHLVHTHHGDATERAVLEVGTAEQPIAADHRALIRLIYLPGMDKNAGPALVNCGGRMDLHGAAMSRTWLKLRVSANTGDTAITLDQAPSGWRVGDRLVLPTTLKLSLFRKGGGIIPSVRDDTQTEERNIKAMDGQSVTLDKKLDFDHAAEGEYRGEVANLSRNVVIESADYRSQNGSLRGHTMYHTGSTGSISYAEFRHLGKPGVLGRYSLHFHQAGDSLRGTSIVGASIWDSGNRWITVHNTNFLVVRDCVGYRSIGHGFFMEDGSEVYNVFDHNLAIQAVNGNPLPDQVLKFDRNDGSGFWWANSLNTFTRNVAVECDQYGFRFEAGKPPEFDSKVAVRQPDGSKATVDIRTLPFIRFEDNEAHAQRRFGLDLGGTRMVAREDAFKKEADGKRGALDPSNTNIGDVGDVGPDNRHPFVVRNFRVWGSHWSFHSFSPNVMIDGLDVYDSNYGIWRSRVEGAEWKNLSMKKIGSRDIFVPFGGKDSYDNSYNKSLSPKDDLPPATIITSCRKSPQGEWVVRGTTEDNGQVTKVVVNGKPAHAIEANYGQWEVRLPADAVADGVITAASTDASGNAEKTPHVVKLRDVSGAAVVLRELPAGATATKSKSSIDMGMTGAPSGRNANQEEKKRGGS